MQHPTPPLQGTDWTCPCNFLWGDISAARIRKTLGQVGGLWKPTASAPWEGGSPSRTCPWAEAAYRVGLSLDSCLWFSHWSPPTSEEARRGVGYSRASFKARIGGRQSEAWARRPGHTGALDLKGHEARESPPPALLSGAPGCLLPHRERFQLLGPKSFLLISAAGAKEHSHLEL